MNRSQSGATGALMNHMLTPAAFDKAFMLVQPATPSFNTNNDSDGPLERPVTDPLINERKESHHARTITTPVIT